MEPVYLCIWRKLTTIADLGLESYHDHCFVTWAITEAHVVKEMCELCGCEDGRMSQKQFQWLELFLLRSQVTQLPCLCVSLTPPPSTPPCLMLASFNLSHRRVFKKDSWAEPWKTLKHSRKRGLKDFIRHSCILPTTTETGGRAAVPPRLIDLDSQFGVLPQFPHLKKNLPLDDLLKPWIPRSWRSQDGHLQQLRRGTENPISLDKLAKQGIRLSHPCAEIQASLAYLQTAVLVMFVYSLWFVPSATFSKGSLN